MIIRDIQDFILVIPSRGKIISLDFGTKKIGIAISSDEQSMALPIATVRCNIDAVIDIVNSHNPCAIVIGMPFNMDGSEGAQAQMVTQFADKLSIMQLPIFLQDERMTSRAASSLLKSYHVKRIERDKIDDQVAACFILDTVLDLVRRFRK